MSVVGGTAWAVGAAVSCRPTGHTCRATRAGNDRGLFRSGAGCDAGVPQEGSVGTGSAGVLRPGQIPEAARDGRIDARVAERGAAGAGKKATARHEAETGTRGERA